MASDHKTRFIANYSDHTAISNPTGSKTGFVCLIIKTKYFLIPFSGLLKVTSRRYFLFSLALVRLAAGDLSDNTRGVPKIDGGRVWWATRLICSFSPLDRD